MRVTESSRLADGVYSLTLQYRENEAPEAVAPGQFVGVYTDDPSALLPRPISICRWNPAQRTLRLVYRVVGKGTAEFSALRPGDEAAVLGVLGNGYDMERLAGRRVLLLGGGIGIPPMLELAAALRRENERRAAGSAQGNADNAAFGSASEAAGRAADADIGKNADGGLVTTALGYRNDELFLKEDFERYCRVLIATEDGSAGVRGNVLDAVRAAGEAAYEVICACGPLPMLRAVKAFAQETGAQCFLSLEERMACGVGACLGCVCKTTKTDAHSKVHNARICTEGPVFAAEDVEL